MRSLSAVPLGLLCSLALTAPSRSSAAQDLFLTIPGLNGESADAQFPGSFDATAVTTGITAPAAAPVAGGAATGQATFAPVVVKLRQSSAGSAALEDAASTGQRFPQAVVSVRRAGEARVVLLTYTLADVGVAAFQREAAAADDVPSESVSLTYGQIRTERRSLNADGSAGPVVTVCWDVRTYTRCP
jgi:type VI secretion system secreted protein Hcp